MIKKKQSRKQTKAKVVEAVGQYGTVIDSDDNQYR